MSRIKLACAAGAIALLVAACSSSHKGASTSTTAAAPPVTTAQTTSAAAAVTTSAAASTPAVAAGAVSGTWKGQYSGGYTGTFTLTWQQASANLSGSIVLSNPPLTLSIHGTVANGAIQFGTVGSVGITYSGTVSGNSMSGSYQVSGSGGGPWSATKS